MSYNMNSQFIKFTPDGEVFVEEKDGKIITHPLRTVAFVEPLPITLRPAHSQFMSDLLDAIRDMQSKMPERSVPVTKIEARDFFTDTDVLPDLLKAQLVKISVVTIPMKDLPDCEVEAIYFTPQGRAFIRKYIDHKYAVTSET